MPGQRLQASPRGAYKSTIYSPRSEFVIVLMIFTQIRIYRVDIEDIDSLEAQIYTVPTVLLLRETRGRCHTGTVASVSTVCDP